MNLRHLLAGAWQDNPFPLVAAFLSVAQVSILMGSSDGTILSRILALALTLEMCVFILIANRYLLGYLITITGKRKDGDTDDHIRSAIFQCSVLLFAIINLYGGVFFAQIGWRYPSCINTGSITCVLTETVHWSYYSAVTITTLGYGDIAPVSAVSQITAAVEALNGLIAFGVFTGAITTYLSRQ